MLQQQESPWRACCSTHLGTATAGGDLLVHADGTELDQGGVSSSSVSLLGGDVFSFVGDETHVDFCLFNN